jgi:hypothetical protein
MIQFSYFGLASAYSFATNGALTANVGSNPTIGNTGAMDITYYNGSQNIKLSGTVAIAATAPVAARSYSTVKRGLFVEVYPDTKLGYMVNPMDETSAHVAVDLIFSDGTYLRNLGAVDQYGVAVHPRYQGESGNVIPNQWNYVDTDLGKVAEGKFITGIVFGFDVRTADPGQEIEALLDSVNIYRSSLGLDVSKFVNMNLVNGTTFAGNTMLIAALYSTKGHLVDSKTVEDVSLSANSSRIISPSIVLDMSKAGEGSYLKLFLWTMSGLVPLMNPVDCFKFS